VKEFIVKLYENNNFPIYLGSIIGVLLIAFFVVFFLGKKDKKKIEMTQKLEQIDPNAFSNLSSAQKVEVPVASQNIEVTQNVSAPVQETPVQVPVQPSAVNEPSAPVQSSYNQVAPSAPVPPLYETPSVPQVEASIAPEPAYQEVAPAMPIEPPVVAPSQQVVSQTNAPVAPMPVTTPVVEQVSPVPEVNVANFENLANSIESELIELEKQSDMAKKQVGYNHVEPVMPVVSEPAVKPVEMPAPEATPAPTKVVNNVFSSVYAPKKEIEIDDTMEIELPKLKEEPVLKETENNLNI